MLLGHKVKGYKGTRLLNYRKLGYQTLWYCANWLLGYQATLLLGYYDKGILGYWATMVRILGYQAAGLQDYKIKGYQGTELLSYQCTALLGYWDTRLLCCPGLECINIPIKIFYLASPRYLSNAIIKKPIIYQATMIQQATGVPLPLYHLMYKEDFYTLS